MSCVPAYCLAFQFISFQRVFYRLENNSPLLPVLSVPRGAQKSHLSITLKFAFWVCSLLQANLPVESPNSNVLMAPYTLCSPVLGCILRAALSRAHTLPRKRENTGKFHRGLLLGHITSFSQLFVFKDNASWCKISFSSLYLEKEPNALF